jgi:hypothetical protein
MPRFLEPQDRATAGPTGPFIGVRL